MTELTDGRPSGGGETRRSTPGDGNSGVAASTDVPAQVTAGPYPGDFSLNFTRNIGDYLKVEFLLEVRYKNDTICLDIESTNERLQKIESSNQWLSHVQPARDRHEQNCEFYRNENGEILLRTLKKVESGEQLLAWYSEQLAREFAIPFLGLHNILGNQQYVCDRCGQTYTHPNPLKLHLVTRCNKGLTTPTKSSSMPDRDILFRPYLECSCPNSKPDRVPPVPGPSHTHRQPYHSHCVTRPLQHVTTLNRSSAIGQQQLKRVFPSENLRPVNLSLKESHGKSKITFHESPFLRPIQIFNHGQPQVFPFSMGTMTSPPYRCCDVWAPYNAILSHHHHHQQQHSTLWAGRQTSSHAQQLANNRQSKCRGKQTAVNLPVPVAMPSEADGEPLDLLPKSFFANKSKKGHYCIYCGKLYSRKYGLKIHLRTHTGYKPLKCKVCLRPFGDPSNLNKHIRLHAQGETPYRCDYCGKVLVRRRDLERHIKSRHPSATGSNFVMSRDYSTDIDSPSAKHDNDQEIVVV
ncbi:PR domain zinc finger protein 13-like [Mizuhopecten yessoensis]|uniref:PR domain zinc finger protein 13 n=1 Tax=Mizuhopecten yessoensis TaxID=6573 RepID=A0A210PLZ4_MIZYE|nr:PR domain zinc finger protein 13-like [Mizuhopecten yessoensis]OWF37528.1 PR domain zinc finger protein 13 [Mizuhopecten yessoensis]